jgi:two-component system response regulator AtoC
VAQACQCAGRQELTIDAAAMAMLEQYSWPGNIRELKNVIERAVVLCDAAEIGPDQLPAEKIRSQPEPPSDVDTATGGPEVDSSPAKPVLRSAEQQRIIDALAACAGNQSRAARMLGMPRRTFISKLDAYGIPRPQKKGFADERGRP